MLRSPSAPPSCWRRPAVAASLVVLAGCVTPPNGRIPPLAGWTQLAPDGRTSLRAVVTAGSECPSASVDGQPQALAERARATSGEEVGKLRDNPAYRPAFPVTACELTLPASARQASVAGRLVPMPRDAVRRIVVVGDTGCRIKVPANGPGDPLQDCTSAANWPWPSIAAAAARTRPDLVIHVGDYHYREYCDSPALCALLRARGEIIGYDWAGWKADFFAPAAPLLAAAPWIFVRGNHEDCDRGGEGWMRFLAPSGYQPCPDQQYRTASASVLANNLTADAYRVDLDDNLTLVVADNAAQRDFLAADATPDDSAMLERSLAALEELPPQRTAWLLVHRPLWYPLIDASAQANALQRVLAARMPTQVQLIVSGHEHAFETINFDRSADPLRYPEGRPAQLIVGNGGTQLEALDPASPLYEGRDGPGSRESAEPDSRLYDGIRASSGIVVNRYGFLLLERSDAGWSGALLDAEGKTISDCRIDASRKAIDCRFPGR
ncbi:metallophosphoesterase [Accumulibacter sp.]|uniref:metallophosphoesterase n=1 Tax=Accumulibacter sp. TaxID=2053492 RepID=UPI0025DC950C|nr:metallophosphoesterase [Accumulibacter sp.]MCM8626579.1 metallophosphoesterase [Accumulibacter sp.]